MLGDLNLNKVLFLDIETVPVKYNFEDLPLEFRKLWEEKTLWQRKKEFSPSEFYKKKAGVMAEFAKVVCISVGYLFIEFQIFGRQLMGIFSAVSEFWEK